MKGSRENSKKPKLKKKSKENKQEAPDQGEVLTEGQLDGVFRGLPNGREGRVVGTGTVKKDVFGNKKGRGGGAAR